MSFANYLADRKKLSQAVAAHHRASPNAKVFPCRCCGGAGLLMEHSKFFRIIGPEFPTVSMPNGDAIISPVMIECPSCDGHGVDKADEHTHIRNELNKQLDKLPAPLAVAS